MPQVWLWLGKKELIRHRIFRKKEKIVLDKWWASVYNETRR